MMTIFHAADDVLFIDDVIAIAMSLMMPLSRCATLAVHAAICRLMPFHDDYIRRFDKTATSRLLKWFFTPPPPRHHILPPDGGTNG